MTSMSGITPGSAIDALASACGAERDVLAGYREHGHEMQDFYTRPRGTNPMGRFSSKRKREHE